MMEEEEEEEEEEESDGEELRLGNKVFIIDLFLEERKEDKNEKKEDKNSILEE